MLQNTMSLWKFLLINLHRCASQVRMVYGKCLKIKSILSSWQSNFMVIKSPAFDLFGTASTFNGQHKYEQKDVFDSPFLPLHLLLQVCRYLF